LNSKEALDESTATNSSVTLSGIRREKEAPTDLDIEDYTPDPGNSDPGFASYRLIVIGYWDELFVHRWKQSRNAKRSEDGGRSSEADGAAGIGYLLFVIWNGTAQRLDWKAE
jgi:hypothetical protein